MGEARRAVLFDLGGTLDAPGIPWKERFFSLYRAEGVRITPEDFAPLFYRADDALVGAISTDLSFRDTVRKIVDGVSAALRIDDQRLSDRIAREFVTRATACAHDNAALLAELAGRYRLGVVSNFYGNLVTVCDDLGLRPYLGVMVDSAAVGCAKPDPRIFQHALDGLDVAASDATFVGDSLSRDMLGARGLGMGHVWLTAAAAPSAAPCCSSDRVIRSLHELRGFLL